MDVTPRYEEKIRKLLTRLLEPTFEVRNDLYLNTLLSHLSGKYDEDLSQRIVNLPLLTEWIIQASSFWESSRRPSQSASVFVLHLTGLISRDEKKFTYFKTFNVYNSLSAVLRVRSPESTPSVKLGYVKMLSSLLCHRSGLDWLISTDNWRDVLNFSLEGQTMYIVREGQQFVVNLLRQSIDYNEIFCKLVIKQVIMKLSDIPMNTVTYPVIQEEVLRKKTEPVIKLIVYLLESFLQETDAKDYRIPHILISIYPLENILFNLSNVAQNVEFVCEIDKGLLLTYFLQTAMVKSQLIPTVDLRGLGAAILKLLNTKVVRNQHLNVLKVCFHAGTYWNYMSHRLPKPTNETSLLRMENHLLPIELLPIVAVTFKNCSILLEDFEIDDIRDEFISKLFRSMNEASTRVAFQWKQQLMQYNDVFPLAIATLRNIMNGRKSYRRSRAILVFQGCVYSFKDITYFVKDNRMKNPDAFIQNPAYIISLINCLSTFINENNITWAESLETICVLSVTIDFLNLQIWNSKVVVEALKLLNLSIAKYMSPNLALLLDDTRDSALDQLGPLLLRMMHDMTWEVRDSALEALMTISTFSCTKFPSFQNVIKGSDLISLALTMAVNDSEAFVRASAIKCLQEMIKVAEFWNPILLGMELPQKMMGMLKNEPEAIVRTEASCLMRCIYEHQAFPIELMDCVYDSMYFAATKDLHWEVKANAMDFWGKVILNHLQNQGMIDGQFPDVTFSKEHKKIITLTENEIKLRLRKVLHQMSNCGCLAVLVTALQDECDIEVVKRAVEKVKKLKSLLDAYKIGPSSQEVSPQRSSVDSPRSNYSPNFNTPPITPRLDYSDEIIDQIVNTNDLSLLTNIYDPLENVANVNVTETTRNKVVSPELFLQVISADLDSIVRLKTKWIQNMDDLDSLLDDILQNYSNSDVNSMDCY